MHAVAKSRKFARIRNDRFREGLSAMHVGPGAWLCFVNGRVFLDGQWDGFLADCAGAAWEGRVVTGIHVCFPEMVSCGGVENQEFGGGGL